MTLLANGESNCNDLEKGKGVLMHTNAREEGDHQHQLMINAFID